jgi:tRNA modification GTPase
MAEMNAHLADNRKGELLRHGIQVAIVGPPNVGKSTLLNCMAQRKAALVSPMPGTTRDIIEVSLNIAGYPVRVADTAGIRSDSHDPIECEGISLALQRSQEAQLRIVVLDVTSPTDALTALLSAGPTLFLLNKCDMIPPETLRQTQSALSARFPDALGVFALSLTTGVGFTEFMTHFGQILATLYPLSTHATPLITQARHRRHLTECVEALHRCSALMHAADVVLAAEELRMAARSLGRITGHIDTEHILDAIFRDFCIGK